MIPNTLLTSFSNFSLGDLLPLNSKGHR